MTQESDAGWQPSDNDRIAFECLQQVLRIVVPENVREEGAMVILWEGNWRKLELYAAAASLALRGHYSMATEVKAKADNWPAE